MNKFWIFPLLIGLVGCDSGTLRGTVVQQRVSVGCVDLTLSTGNNDEHLKARALIIPIADYVGQHVVINWQANILHPLCTPAQIEIK